MKPSFKSKSNLIPVAQPDILTEFRKYLIIDKHSLTEAMAEQADLFFRVADAHALAVSVRDEAKEQLASVDASLGQELRTNGKKEERLTEASIKELVQIHPKHTQAFNTYAQAKKHTEQLAALREAFQNREKMLRDLGQLYSAGYFTITASKGASAELGRQKLNEACGRK